MNGYYLSGGFIDENQDRNYERTFKNNFPTYHNKALYLHDKLKEAGHCLPAQAKCLEIGSHSGYFLAAIKKVFPDSVVHGIEPDKGAAI